MSAPKESLIRKLAEQKGILLDDQQWRHVNWLWYEPLSKLARVEPGIKETLTAIKESGIKLGIVSNTFVHSSTLEKHLEQFLQNTLLLYQKNPFLQSNVVA